MTIEEMDARYAEIEAARDALDYAQTCAHESGRVRLSIIRGRLTHQMDTLREQIRQRVAKEMENEQTEDFTPFQNCEEW